jgi:hypothetical protein
MAKDTVTISELASRVFQARDCAHRRHWQTRSYSEHKALNAFYDDVVEAIDAVIENFQGMFGNIDDFEVQTESVKDMTAYLTDEMDFIESNRNILSQGSDSIGALIDNLVSVYSRTVFMLGLSK